MHSTQQALAYQEEWRVAAVVSTMKSCRYILAANRLARVTIRMYTVGKKSIVHLWIVFSPVCALCAEFIASVVQESIQSEFRHKTMHSHWLSD